MKRLTFVMFILSLLYFQSNSCYADSRASISIEEIVKDAVECTECMDWKIVGVCFWLKCSLWDCSVEESVKVGHFIPEVVVATYSTYTPLNEMNFFGDDEPAAFSRKESTDDMETFINFKHAEIYGNPAVILFSELADDSNYFCKPSATEFEPYFIDKYDPFWINSFIERLFPQSIIGYPQIESNVTTGYWAPEYPRCGWGANPVDAINGAVAAQRAAEIATSDTFAPHIYNKIPTDGCNNAKCWPPKPVQVNDDPDNHFQLIHPVVADSAHEIGGKATWANGKNESSQTYAWNLWRRYKCCEKKGQFFLFSIDVVK